jgi:peptidoglycan/xylan/chitin deacetylase (PgdA/CDA1 family)
MASSTRPTIAPDTKTPLKQAILDSLKSIELMMLVTAAFSVVALIIYSNFFKGHWMVRVKPIEITQLSESRLHNRDDISIQPTGLPTAPPERKLRALKIPVITYHYVEYVKDKGDKVRHSLAVTPYTFEHELKTLATEHVETLFVKDIPGILRGDRQYNPKSVALTFDDGYEDFYENVFPLLKKYRAKATYYIINDYIGRRGFITEPQLKEVASSGLVEIGAHTLDHAYLKGALPEYAVRQIVESKADLEKRLGMKITTFAYPYGAFTPATVAMVKKASFEAAVSTINGVSQSGENLFYLYRVRAGYFTGTSIAEVLARL